MEEERPEFFKLDETDRRVLIWLMTRVKPKAIKNWIDFIADDYKRRNAIIIDTQKLFIETQEKKR